MIAIGQPGRIFSEFLSKLVRKQGYAFTPDASLKMKLATVSSNLTFAAFMLLTLFIVTQLYLFLVWIGKENLLSIRDLTIQLPNDFKGFVGKMHDRAGNSGTKGPCIGRIFDLLSRGHNLRRLTLVFDNPHRLVWLPFSSRIMSDFEKLKGIKVLQIEIKDVPLTSWNQNMKHAASRLTEIAQRPRDIQQAAGEAPVILQKAPLPVHDVSALLASRDDLVARRRAAEKEAEDHERKRYLADQRAKGLDARIAALEADMKKFMTMQSD